MKDDVAFIWHCTEISRVKSLHDSRDIDVWMKYARTYNKHPSKYFYTMIERKQDVPVFIFELIRTRKFQFNTHVSACTLFPEVVGTLT